MFAVPEVAPETIPEVEPTVATLVLLLVQLPPAVRLLSVKEEPGHTVLGPVMDAGSGLTVTTVVFEQPVEVKVNVMGVVPAEAGVTTPVDEPIAATVVFPLTHLPAPDASVKVIVEPTQTGVLLPGTAGSGDTLTAVVATAPHCGVYDIVALPAATPVTMPVAEPTVAIDVLLLVHTPPVEVVESVIVAPGHMGAAPVIAAAGGHHWSIVPLAGCVHVALSELLAVEDVVEVNVE